jgi:group I intron endonuclease
MKENSNCYGYIYVITNKISKRIYIGQTTKKGKLFRKYLGSGTYITRAINKYKKINFYKQILDYAFSKEELDCLEQFYIDFFSSSFLELGYNLTLGGTSGTPNERTRNKIIKSSKKRIVSEETKKKISNSISGEKHYNYGKKMSKETINKIRKTCLELERIPPNKGISTSEEVKNKIREKRKSQIMTNKIKVINIETGEIFESMREACKKYKMSPALLTNCCKGKNGIKTAGSFHWKYYEERKEN